MILGGGFEFYKWPRRGYFKFFKYVILIGGDGGVP
jgi:hypothetical protein